MFSTLIRLCRFAASPQDFPASRGAVVGNAVFCCVAIFIANAMMTDLTRPALALAQTALLGGGLWLLLRLHGKTSRWAQSATALFGAAAVTNLLALPAVLWFSQDTVVGAVGLGGMSLVMLALFRLWFLALMVFVVKETLEVTIGRAVVLTVLLQLLFGIVLLTLFTAGTG